MVEYQIMMKPLSYSDPWQDVTSAVVKEKGFKLRKGFGSLEDSLDVGSVSIKLHMATLEDATLLHVERKQVLIKADGVAIFEGVSYDDSNVDLRERSDYVFTTIKFKPYSALFEEAKVPEDMALIDRKVCDPSDTEDSLLHIFFNLIIDNLEEQAREIMASVFNIATTISNTGVLPLVLLKKGESIESYLTDFLYQNGYSYYMDLYTAVVVEPYKPERIPTVEVPLKDILKSPKISQAPYVDDTKVVVKLGKVERHTSEIVYELNRARDEDTGEPTEMAHLEPGDYYPVDSEEAPSILEATYGSERENDDMELIYTEGLSLSYHARQIDPSNPDRTIRAYIYLSQSTLNTLQADLQFYNNLGVEVSLRNVRILAETAFYRNWSEKYYDEESTSDEEDEIEGIYILDPLSAKAFIQRHRAERLAEGTRVTFQSHIALQPNTLFTIEKIPYQLMVRYVTEVEPKFYEYECVAHSMDPVIIGSKIRVASQRGVLDGATFIPVHTYALGDENGPLGVTDLIAYDHVIVADDRRRLGAYDGWSRQIPIPGPDQFVWERVGHYAPPATWPAEWSAPIRLTGLPGEDARLITILASSTIIPVTGKGTPKIGAITLTAELHNIPLPAEGLVWTPSQTGLTLTVVDDYSVSFATADVVMDSLTVQVSAGIYTSHITIVKVADGVPAPVYGGVLAELPTEINGEPIGPGDFFLYIPEKVGGGYDEDDPNFGHVLKWTGSGWVSTTDSYSIGIASKDAFVIARESGKVIFAMAIYAEALVAYNMQAGSGTGLSGSGFRFRAMSDDYSQQGSPKVPVFDVMFGDQVLFKVDIATGKIYFGEHFWYDPATESIRSTDDNLVINADGTLEGKLSKFIDGDFTGTANIKEGLFEANINAPSFSSLPGSGGTSGSFSGTTAKQQVEGAYNTIKDFLVPDKLYPCVVSGDSSVKYISHDGGFIQLGSSFNVTLHVPGGTNKTMSGVIVPFSGAQYTSPYAGQSKTFTFYYGMGDVFKFKNLPTDDVGLSSGQVWRDGTTLKIVP